MSLVITIVGMVVLWPLAAVIPGAGVFSFEGVLLFALSGVLSPGLVRLLYYKGLKTLGVSVNSSIFAVYPLYSALLAVILLSEILTAWNAVGIIAILLGVIFVEMSINGNNGQSKNGWKNLVFPVLGGLTLGVSSIIRKYALGVYNAPVLGVAVAYAFSLLPYALILAFSVPTRRFGVETGFPMVLGCRRRTSSNLDAGFLRVKLRDGFHHGAAAVNRDAVRGYFRVFLPKGGGTGVNKTAGKYSCHSDRSCTHHTLAQNFFRPQQQPQ